MQKFPHSFPSLNSDGLLCLVMTLLLLDETNEDAFKLHICASIEDEKMKTYANLGRTRGLQLSGSYIYMLSMEPIPLISGQATDIRSEKNKKTN